VEKFNNFDLATRGNLKKLSILEAMTSSPKLLLVDEPEYLIDLRHLLDVIHGLKTYSQRESECSWSCKHCKMDCSGPSKNCVIFSFNSMLLSLKFPSIIDHFDKIILMSITKQIIFFGTVDDAVSIIGNGTMDGLIMALENVSLDKKVETHESEIKKTSRQLKYQIQWYSQVLILLKRHWYQLNNKPKQIIRVIIQRTLIFILVSFIFAQPKARGNLIGIFFLLPINQTANVLLFSATEGFAPNELKAIQQARFSKLYRSWTLVVAKLIILIPINIVPAIIYLPTLFFISAFRTDSSFVLYSLANLLHIACIVPLGLFIAASSQDPFIRDLWLFGLTTLFTTFGGIHTAANFELSWILRWIQYLSPTYYLFVILIQLEFTDDEIANVIGLGKFLLSVGEAFAALAGLLALFILLSFISTNISTKPSRILF
jgi:ABC-type multidrug transport system permease subunit